MIDYRNEIMVLIEKCLHKFAEQRIVELGIQQSWQSRLADEVRNRYPVYPNEHMLLHRFLEKHSPREIDLKNLDTTAMCALYNNIPDFRRMCEIQTAQRGTFINHINDLRNSRNAIEHYAREILPEQYQDFFFDQLNALYSIAAFASLVERHCPTNETWKRIILESTQLERRFHWEKWITPYNEKERISYSDENLSDILFAAEAGNVEAQLKAGKIYYNGEKPWLDGKHTDYDSAFYWFNKAALTDNAEAKYYLASCLSHNLVLYKYTGNISMREELIEESAKQGFAPAQACLGKKYCFNSKTTEEEKAWDFKWTKLAADQNYPPALWTLSEYYRSGHGVNMDVSESDRLAHRASELGDSFASLQLGIAAEKDGKYEEAINLYRLADKKGEPFADSYVCRLEKKMKKMNDE